MSEHKPFGEMTLDELTEHKQGLKSQVDSIHEEAREASTFQNTLIQEEHVERARVSMQDWADRNGKTLDEAIEYWEGRLEPETGQPGRWIQSLLLQGKEGKIPL